MGEAAKYTTEMWQRHVGRMVNLMWSSETKRLAFIDGFNQPLGRPRHKVHYTARDAWDLGRHTALLLGYDKPQPGSSE